MLRKMFGLYFLLLTGCASGPYEVSQKEYERLVVGKDNNSFPSFFVLSEAASNLNGRAPASAVGQQSEALDEEVAALNDKQLYFFTLLEQKIELEKLLSIDNTLKICPAFHHDLVTKKSVLSEQKKLTYEKNWTALAANKKLASEPVLALPLKQGRDLYSTYLSKQKIGKDDVASALKDYYQKTQNEIEQLCETGASDGYYVFNNMLLYHGDLVMSAGVEEALGALLRMSPVANYYVLKSLADDFANTDASPLQTMMMQKLKATWFKDYLYRVYALEHNKAETLYVGR